MSDKVDKLAGEIKKSHPNMTHRQVMQKAREAFVRADRNKK